MSGLNVLVVGASVAGPATAYWLAKAGARVTVIERFPQLRTNGQNVDIRTAGVSVMRRTPGMEQSVRAKLMDFEGVSLVRDDGRPYGVLRATGNPDQQSLVSEYEIPRGDLSRILVDLTRDNENVQYVFGVEISTTRQIEGDGGPVTVEFSNGHPTSQYDLVVACDGATSKTRAIGFGCGARDYMIPSNCWAAYFSIEQDLLSGSKIGQGFSAPGGRFMAIGPTQPGKNRVLFMSIHPPSASDVSQALYKQSKIGDGALKQFVAERYRGAGWKTDEVLEFMAAAKDFYANEFVTVKVPSLYSGRFALVGDAGYASAFTGSGTTLALAGAYFLAGEICKHKGDLTAGLQGYEARMRPLVDELQKQPPFITSFIAPQTAWGIWLRNSIFAFITWTKIIDFAQKYFTSSFASNERYPLPEYEWEA